MKWFRGVFYVLFLLLCAYDVTATNIVKATPYTRYNSNGFFEILIEFDIKSGWHIFGPYEQEFGSPLKINWKLGSREKVLEECFSRTKRFDQEDFSFDGYEYKAYYKTTIQAPVSTENFSAVLNWQACADDECLPESVNIAISSKNDPYFDEVIRSAEEYFVSNDFVQKTHLSLILLMAFSGGIILNLMPCIFPILSIKLFSLLRTSVITRKKEALFYTLGVVVSMLVVAGSLYIVRLYNSSAAWGFQLQSPWFVGIMLIVFIILSLMMFDIINVRAGWLNSLIGLRFKNRFVNSFMTGLLAVLIATPCTAPFMGAAIAYALMSPVYIYFPVFTALALGYALPFALLAYYPKILKKVLPKPGKWMIIIKRILGIPLILTCIWLIWILAAQTGFIASGKNLKWTPYSPSVVKQALIKKQPVFIDFTAKWCITCLVNKKTALQSDNLAELVKNKNILLLRADATLPDKTVVEGLKFYKRASVPLYVYYDGKSDDYLVLPQILTIGILEDYLQ